MNISSPVLPTAATSADTPTRAANADSGEAGGFAQVLGRQLERAGDGQEPDTAAGGGRPPRQAPRKTLAEAERHAMPTDALPLIAAALESRSLARGAAAGAHGEAAVAAAAGPVLPQLQAGAEDIHEGLVPGAHTPSLASAPAAPAGASTAAAMLQAAPAGAQRLEPPFQAHAPAPNALESAADTAAAEAATPIRTSLRADRDGASVLPPSATVSAPTTTPDATLEALAAARAALQPQAQPGDPVSARDESLPAPVAALSSVATATTSAAASVLATPAPAVPAQAWIAPPVASPAWGAALGQEVARLHQAGHQQAQLELNPPGLGPLSVSLSVQDQHAQAAFFSPHAAVRAAIEAALPQLRNALAESGIQLGQSSVGAEQQPGAGAFAQDSQQQGRSRGQGATAQPIADDHPEPLPAAPRRATHHNLDTFA